MIYWRCVLRTGGQVALGCRALKPTRRPEGIDLTYGLGRITKLGSSSRLPIPRQQAFQLVTLGASGYDAFEYIGQPGQRIDVVKLTGFKQARYNSPMTSSAIAAREKMIPSAKNYRLDCPLNGVGVQFQTAIIEEASQSFPVIQGIPDRLGQFGAAGDTLKLLRKPGMHRLDERSTALLTYRSAVLGRRATDLGFDLIQRSDLPQGFLGDRRLVRDVDVVKLAPRVSKAKGEFAGIAVLTPQNCAKALIAIDLNDPRKTLQMARRMHTLAILAVDIGNSWMPWTSPRPIINSITPQPSGLGATTAWVQHRQSGVVGEHLGRRQHRLQQQFVQRAQPPAGTAHPIAQRRAVQHHPLAGKDLCLTVQRQMIGVLVDQHMRQQRLGRDATVNRPIGRRCLNHRFLTTATAIARATDHPDPQLSRGVIQHLNLVFTDPMQRPPATGARLVLDIDHHLDAGQMRWQVAAVAFDRFSRARSRSPIRRRRGLGVRRLALASGGFRRLDLGGLFGQRLLRILELLLDDFVAQSFGAATELMALQFGDHLLQTLDFGQCLEQDRLQSGWVVWQRLRRGEHQVTLNRRYESRPMNP